MRMLIFSCSCFSRLITSVITSVIEERANISAIDYLLFGELCHLVHYIYLFILFSWVSFPPGAWNRLCRLILVLSEHFVKRFDLFICSLLIKLYLFFR